MKKCLALYIDSPTPSLKADDTSKDSMNTEEPVPSMLDPPHAHILPDGTRHQIEVIQIIIVIDLNIIIDSFHPS